MKLTIICFLLLGISYNEAAHNNPGEPLSLYVKTAPVAALEDPLEVEEDNIVQDNGLLQVKTKFSKAFKTVVRGKTGNEIEDAVLPGLMIPLTNAGTEVFVPEDIIKATKVLVYEGYKQIQTLFPASRKRSATRRSSGPVKREIKGQLAKGMPFSFQYIVDDEPTENFQTRHEEGDKEGVVRGCYQLLDPFGFIRTVIYRADSDGFQIIAIKKDSDKVPCSGFDEGDEAAPHESSHGTSQNTPITLKNFLLPNDANTYGEVNTRGSSSFNGVKQFPIKSREQVFDQQSGSRQQQTLQQNNKQTFHAEDHSVGVEQGFKSLKLNAAVESKSNSYQKAHQKQNSYSSQQTEHQSSRTKTKNRQRNYKQSSRTQNSKTSSQYTKQRISNSQQTNKHSSAYSSSSDGGYQSSFGGVGSNSFNAQSIGKSVLDINANIAKTASKQTYAAPNQRPLEPTKPSYNEPQRNIPKPAPKHTYRAPKTQPIKPIRPSYNEPQRNIPKPTPKQTYSFPKQPIISTKPSYNEPQRNIPKPAPKQTYSFPKQPIKSTKPSYNQPQRNIPKLVPKQTYKSPKTQPIKHIRPSYNQPQRNIPKPAPKQSYSFPQQPPKTPINPLYNPPQPSHTAFSQPQVDLDRNLSYLPPNEDINAFKNPQNHDFNKQTNQFANINTYNQPEITTGFNVQKQTHNNEKTRTQNTYQKESLKTNLHEQSFKNTHKASNNDGQSLKDTQQSYGNNNGFSHFSQPAIDYKPKTLNNFESPNQQKTRGSPQKFGFGQSTGSKQQSYSSDKHNSKTGKHHFNSNLQSLKTNQQSYNSNQESFKSNKQRSNSKQHSSKTNQKSYTSNQESLKNSRNHFHSSGHVAAGSSYESGRSQTIQKESTEKQLSKHLQNLSKVLFSSITKDTTSGYENPFINFPFVLIPITKFIELRDKGLIDDSVRGFGALVETNSRKIKQPKIEKTLRTYSSQLNQQNNHQNLHLHQTQSRQSHSSGFSRPIAGSPGFNPEIQRGFKPLVSGILGKPVLGTPGKVPQKEPLALYSAPEPSPVPYYDGVAPDLLPSADTAFTAKDFL